MLFKFIEIEVVGFLILGFVERLLTDFIYYEFGGLVGDLVLVYLITDFGEIGS
jgi:hypothetical protein